MCGKAILRLFELSQREVTQGGPYEGIFMYEGFIWDLGGSFQVENLQILWECLEVDRVQFWWLQGIGAGTAGIVEGAQLSE